MEIEYKQSGSRQWYKKIKQNKDGWEIEVERVEEGWKLCIMIEAEWNE